jgi:phosphate:Na+ symporter
MATGSETLQVLIALLGGVGLFLLGMGLLTDGFKLAAGRTLERILATWTRTPLHGLITGVSLTALMQSSTALTVAMLGFVNAGLLSFSSALWVIFGSNVGSSATGWLIAMVGFKVDLQSYALPFVGIGMALKITGNGTRRGAIGAAIAGFGVLFLGIDMLKQGFENLGADALPELGDGLADHLLAVLVGLLLTILLQASSATLTITLAAVAGGMIPLSAGACIVIGANIGTTLTAILAAIGATANARRLAMAHVLFNLITAVVALIVLAPLLMLIEFVQQRYMGGSDPVGQLVIFHTLFNALGVLLMWPIAGSLSRFLLARFRRADEDEAKPRYLDRNVIAVPALAQQALHRELARMGSYAVQLADAAVHLNPRAESWTEPSLQARQKLSQRLEVVSSLQQRIGEFISQLSRGAVSAEIAMQLPEMLRIAAYFEAMARLSYHVGILGADDERPLAGAAGDEQAIIMAAVAPVFTDAQRLFAAVDPELLQHSGSTELVREMLAEFETSYQQGKADLLRIGAAGQANTHQVYDWLARLSDLRRAAEQGSKGIQALAALPDLEFRPGACERPANENAVTASERAPESVS